TPSVQNFNAASSTGAVSVLTSPGCSWNAVSNSGFVTITSGSSGVGNGTVNYSVNANLGAARVGTVTIAGQVFQVFQAAQAGGTTTITSINPASPVASSFDQNVTVFGDGTFQPGLTVSITFPGGGGTTLSGAQIQSVTSNSFVMIVTLNAVGTWTIRVNNPGGPSSNVFAFPVQAGSSNPTITSIAPASPAPSSFDQSVAVSGSGFKPGLIVFVTFPDGGMAILGGAQIQNVISTSFTMIITLNGVGTWTIRVLNPDGGQSNTLAFVVQGGGGCTYLIAPAQQSFGTGGGEGAFDVNTALGCTWTATNGAG